MVRGKGGGMGGRDVVGIRGCRGGRRREEVHIWWKVDGKSVDGLMVVD